MKTNLLFAIVLVGLLSCDKDDPEPVELMSNGNVEFGTTYPQYWSASLGLTEHYQIEWSKAEHVSPDRSLKISIPTAEKSDFAFWSQVVNTNIPVGKSVVLKVKVKTKLTGVGAAIAVRVDETKIPSGSAKQFKTTQGVTSITGTQDWKEYSVQLDNIVSTAQSLTIYLLLLDSTTGEVYFDDISLTTK